MHILPYTALLVMAHTQHIMTPHQPWTKHKFKRETTMNQNTDQAQGPMKFLSNGLLVEANFQRHAFISTPFPKSLLISHLLAALVNCKKSICQPCYRIVHFCLNAVAHAVLYC